MRPLFDSFSVEHSRRSVQHCIVLVAGPRRFSIARIRDLASHFARPQFSKRPSENTKRREVAAQESINLAGPVVPEPATSGVTGRRSNCFRNVPLGRASANSLKTHVSTFGFAANESANESDLATLIDSPVSDLDRGPGAHGGCDSKAGRGLFDNVYKRGTRRLQGA